LGRISSKELHEQMCYDALMPKLKMEREAEIKNKQAHIELMNKALQDEFKDGQTHNS
jgi:hypothetical protein